MVRHESVANTIARLEQRIALALQGKEKISGMKTKLDRRYRDKEISHEDYLFEKVQDLDGRTIEEWIKYYDSYVELCRREIKRWEKKISAKKVFISVGVVAVFVLMAFVIFTYVPNFIGFVVEEQAPADEPTVAEPEPTVAEPEPTVVEEVISEQPIIEEVISEQPIIEEVISENVSVAEVSVEENVSVAEKEVVAGGGGVPIVVAPNVSVENITEIVNVSVENITEIVNATIGTAEVLIDTVQYRAVIGRPVKWLKVINVTERGSLVVDLPRGANNISILTDEEIDNAEADVGEYEDLVKGKAKKDLLEGVLTGNVVTDIATSEGFFTRFWNWVTGFGVTGQVILEEDIAEDIVVGDEEVSLNLSKLSPYEDFIGVGYYTEAPMAVEEDIEKGKRVVVSTFSEFGYENVLAYTNLSKEVKESEILIYHIVEGERVRINFSAFDLNENGLVDYVEWNVDHLSEQVYEIVIEIIKAEVMDANRNFVRDVYGEVKSLDDVWTEVMDGEYLRVTFESVLDSSRDITIFPRVISGSPRIEVYEVGGSELIAEFEVLNSGEYNKVYLTNLVDSQDVFDLRVVGGVVEIDHVIDPFQGNTPGLAVYGEGIQVIPRYRDWSGLNFDTEQNAPTITAGTINRVVVKSSTTRNQTAVVIGDSQGDILLSVRNNTNEVFSSWLDVASIGTTNDNFRGFYVDVEQNSGDFLVVYEKDITADRLLYYRTWNGNSWSGEGTITLNGDVAAEAQLFVVMSSKFDSDEIMMASAGGSDDITAVRWDGTSWVNVTTITTLAAAIDEERFSLAWESGSGDAMIVWGEGTTNANYNIFSDSTKSWGTSTLIRNRATAVQQIQICSDPKSDYIGAIIGPDGTGDVLAVMWDGNSWLSGEPGEEGAAENVVMSNAFCQWTKNGGTALFGYVVANALNINYFQYDLVSGTWTCPENGQTVSDLDNLEGSNGPCNSQDGTVGVMSNDIEVLRAVGDPNSNDIMVWGIDLAEDLEFFIFNGTHLDQPVNNLLEATTTTVAANEPGWFDYFRFILRVYPQFSGYWDNNGTIFNSGIGVFNVSVVNTNGTVLLEVNGTNYSAVNVGGDVYSVNVALITGDYPYRWHSWGDGQSKDYNVSSTRNYSVGVLDDPYPQFSSLIESPNDPAVYSVGGSYQFDSTITSSNGTAGIEFDGVNYSATNSSSIFSSVINDLAVGFYNYYWWSFGSGSSKFFNKTFVQTYSVNKATSSVSLTLYTLSSNVTITQDNPIDLNCSLVSGDSGGALKMYSDGVLINSGTMSLVNTTSFSNVGLKNISCFYDASQNYSESFQTFWINVTETLAEPLTKFTSFTESPNDPAVYSPNAEYEFNVTATYNNGTVGIEFDEINYTPAKFGDDFSFNISGLVARVGEYFYKWWGYSNNTDKNLSSSLTLSYTVNQAESLLNLSLGGIEGNFSINQSQGINLRCEVLSGEVGGVLKMYRDGILIDIGSMLVSNFTTFDFLGLENITCIYESSQNYFGSTKTWFVNVSNFPVTTPTNIMCNGGDCDIVVNDGLLLAGVGSVDSDLVTYFLEANLKSFDLYSNFSAISFKTSGGALTDSTPQTCSGQWGWDCSTGPPETGGVGGDNTFDTCGTGTGADESVEQIYLNVTSAVPGEAVQVICNFDPYTSSDSTYISYYNGTGWIRLFSHVNWGASSLTNESAVFIVNNSLGVQWVRCSIEYVTTENAGPCYVGGSYYDNDDINFTVVAAGGSVKTDVNTSEIFYESFGENNSLLSEIKIIVEVDSYNPSGSVAEGTSRPDLFLEVYDGSGWYTIGELGLEGIYTGGSLDNTNRNFSVVIMDSVVLAAWQDVSNQDFRIKAVSLDFSSSSIYDEINYSGVWISLNSLNWTLLGNHTEGNNFFWNSSQISEQTCVNLRTRAIDLGGMNIYSDYFTKGNCLNISRGIVDNFVPEVYVSPVSSQNPIESGVRDIVFNFGVYDEDGFADINFSSVFLSIEKAGESSKVNGSCVEIMSSGDWANFSCSIYMMYYDKSGDWTIRVNVADFSGASVSNSANSFTYNQLVSMVMSPTVLAWETINFGLNNIGSANDPIVINNTGNDESLTIQVTAYDLQGEIISTDYIYADNFSVGIVSEGCAGDLMSNSSGIVISGSVLDRGNNSLGQGQEDVYFCLKGLPANIAAQDYSSSGIGAWDIRIVLVVLTAGKLKKKEKKGLKNDRLVSAMGLIAEELKEKYSLSSAEVVEALTDELMEKFGVSVSEISALRSEKKMEIPLKVFAGGELGALEAVVKYMKENLGMKYSEIGEKLGRDQRTVWTAYKKGCGKSDVVMKFEEGGDSVPLDIFVDDRLTVLEAIVVYLKRDKKMRYSEIGEILGRDQRNVWGVCARAEKKNWHADERGLCGF